MLYELTEELFSQNIIFTATDEVKNHILNVGYDDKYGARPLRRVIEKQIQNKIAELLISGKIEKHSKLLAVLNENEIEIKIEN